MGKYMGNVAIVFGKHDVNAIRTTLERYYGLTVDTVQTVTPDAPYRGEIRTEGNTLLHVATEITLTRDLYSKEYVESTLPLEAVGMTTEALSRANLIQVLLKDDAGQIYYFPHTVALYADEEYY